MQGLSALPTADEQAKPAPLSGVGGARAGTEGAFAALLGRETGAEAVDDEDVPGGSERERPAAVNLAAIASAEMRTASPDSGWAPPSGSADGGSGGGARDSEARPRARAGGTAGPPSAPAATAGADRSTSGTEGSGKAANAAVVAPGGGAAGAGNVHSAGSRVVAAAAPRGAGRAVTNGTVAAVAGPGRAGVTPMPAPAAAAPAAKGVGPQLAVNAAARAAGAAEAKFRLRMGAQDAPRAQSPRETEHEAFAAQVGRGLASVLRQGGGSVVLRLQPHALGDLKVRLSIGEGVVSARFEVRTEQARRLLDADMATLRSALEARGLSVEKLDVRFAEPVVDRPSESEPSRQDPRSGSGAENGGAGDAAERRGERGAGGWNPPGHSPRAMTAGATDGAGPGSSGASGGVLTISLGLDAVA